MRLLIDAFQSIKAISSITANIYSTELLKRRPEAELQLAGKNAELLICSIKIDMVPSEGCRTSDGCGSEMT